MSDGWGQTVIGTKVVEVRSEAAATGVNTLAMGSVRKKRKGGPEAPRAPPPPMPLDTAPIVNTLATSLIRKKAKT